MDEVKLRVRVTAYSTIFDGKGNKQREDVTLIPVTVDGDDPEATPEQKASFEQVRGGQLNLQIWGKESHGILTGGEFDLVLRR